jgi:hypothetical protein
MHLWQPPIQQSQVCPANGIQRNSWVAFHSRCGYTENQKWVKIDITINKALVWPLKVFNLTTFVVNHF